MPDGFIPYHIQTSKEHKQCLCQIKEKNKCTSATYKRQKSLEKTLPPKVMYEFERGTHETIMYVRWYVCKSVCMLVIHGILTLVLYKRYRA